MSMGGKFRKKPVIIEAHQFDGEVDSANQILAWVGKHGGSARRAHHTITSLGLIIDTLEGGMHVDVDDWVIRGLQGEFYPCKPDIFRDSYERVTYLRLSA